MSMIGFVLVFYIVVYRVCVFFFFFQAEDGIRDGHVTGGQTCALPIYARLARRRLIRVHQGVYAVGHAALSDRGRMIAALLAAGPGAVLSHETAAYLWKLIPSLPQFIDVTHTDRVPRTRHRLHVH